MEIIITIDKANEQSVLDAFSAITDTRLSIEMDKFGKPEDMVHGRIDLSIKKPDVIDQKFLQSAFEQIGLAIVKMVSKSTDEKRYRAAIAAVEPPKATVSDDIFKAKVG